MATFKSEVLSRTSLTVTGLNSLASGTYVASSAYNCSTNDNEDVLIEVRLATTNTPASLKQCSVFLKVTLNGTDYSTGPESGTTTTDEPDLIRLGAPVPMNTASTDHVGIYSVKAALGFIPHSFKLIVKNEIGVALTSGTVFTSEVSKTVV